MEGQGWNLSGPVGSVLESDIILRAIGRRLWVLSYRVTDIIWFMP